MTTAPMTADFAQTVNAVGIGSSAWLERPALIVNKIKAFVSLKITANTSCNPKRLGYSLDMKTKNNVSRIENYNLNASNGRHIRTATKVIFKDGSEVRFTEKMSKRLALAQLV